MGSMLTYRTFRNTDPPAIVGIWRSRAGQPGLMHPVSVDLLEQLVFGKLYFDYSGLVLAWDDGQPVGFAHAGFGPNEQESSMSLDYGVTSIIMTRADRPDVAAGLLERCEQYLHERGAKVLYGGSIRPLNPFYLGLYGGSEQPGVLESDKLAQETFRAHGYREIDQTLIFERSLTNFQATVDRQQLQIRRQTTVQMTVDAPTETWWQACTIGDYDLTRFDLLPRGGGRVLASALFRNMVPAGISTFVRQAGLIDLQVDPACRRQGMAIALLSEAFTTFLRQGITVVEAQTNAPNVPAQNLYRKLGFTQTGRGSVFRKESGR
jgi:GNAT superfamily N-acetyltransferase